MTSDKKPQYFGTDLEAMSFATNYHQWIMDEFRPYLGDIVAEVGAGTGNFSELLLMCKPIKYLLAFEPSENMYPILKEKFKREDRIEVNNAFFGEEAGKYVGRLDSILYVNVLEHIEDDKRELIYAFDVLKSGGYILIFVPALSWLYSELDKQLGHYRRYHKQHLVHLVKSVGFRIIKVKYFDFMGILPWYIVFVLLKKSISGGKVSLYDKVVVPVMQLLESTINPPIGKNILLVGQKP